MTDFDPSQHTVADVEAYVDEHPDEAAAVLAAEQAGKNRTTLVNALHSDVPDNVVPIVQAEEGEPTIDIDAGHPSGEYPTEGTWGYGSDPTLGGE